MSRERYFKEYTKGITWNINYWANKKMLNNFKFNFVLNEVFTITIITIQDFREINLLKEYFLKRSPGRLFIFYLWLVHYNLCFKKKKLGHNCHTIRPRTHKSKVTVEHNSSQVTCLCSNLSFLPCDYVQKITWDKREKKIDEWNILARERFSLLYFAL